MASAVTPPSMSARKFRARSLPSSPVLRLLLLQVAHAVVDGLADLLDEFLLGLRRRRGRRQDARRLGRGTPPEHQKRSRRARKRSGAGSGHDASPDGRPATSAPLAMTQSGLVAGLLEAGLPRGWPAGVTDRSYANLGIARCLHYTPTTAAASATLPSIPPASPRSATRRSHRRSATAAP